jgi:hypothetical protein
MTKDEALKLALEALEEAADAIDSWGSYASGYFQVKHDLESDISKAKSAITVIKQALVHSEQEPVACVEYIPCCTDQTCPKCKAAIKPELVCVCGAVWEGQELIYTPPQRTWVGLTDEEVGKWTPEIHAVIRAIEAKLKEKNT